MLVSEACKCWRLCRCHLVHSKACYNMCPCTGLNNDDELRMHMAKELMTAEGAVSRVALRVLVLLCLAAAPAMFSAEARRANFQRRPVAFISYAPKVSRCVSVTVCAVHHTAFCEAPLVCCGPAANKFTMCGVVSMVLTGLGCLGFYLRHCMPLCITHGISALHGIAASKQRHCASPGLYIRRLRILRCPPGSEPHPQVCFAAVRAAIC